MIWTFLLSNWRGAILGLALSLSAAFFWLWRHEVSAYEEFRNQESAKGLAAEMHVKQVEQQQKEITNDTVTGWKAALDVTRTDYDKRMRSYARGSGLSIIPQAPSRIDDLPADSVPLAAQCAETTLQLIKLQDWTNEQERVK